MMAGTRLTGVAASEGVAVGPAFVHVSRELEPEREKISEGEIEEELGCYRSAVEAVAKELSATVEELRAGGSEKEATVVPEAGLHARPAARFVKEAKSYSSDIVVIKDGREANAKSSLRLMTLGAKHGERVVVRAEGEDEEAAVDALVAILSEEEEE